MKTCSCLAIAWFIYNHRHHSHNLSSLTLLSCFLRYGTLAELGYKYVGQDQVCSTATIHHHQQHMRYCSMHWSLTCTTATTLITVTCTYCCCTTILITPSNLPTFLLSLSHFDHFYRYNHGNHTTTAAATTHHSTSTAHRLTSSSAGLSTTTITPQPLLPPPTTQRPPLTAFTSSSAGLGPTTNLACRAWIGSRVKLTQSTG
jgi:hypothetical protein